MYGVRVGAVGAVCGLRAVACAAVHVGSVSGARDDSHKGRAPWQ